MIEVLRPRDVKHRIDLFWFILRTGGFGMFGIRGCWVLASDSEYTWAMHDAYKANAEQRPIARDIHIRRMLTRYKELLPESSSGT